MLSSVSISVGEKVSTSYVKSEDVWSIITNKVAQRTDLVDDDIVELLTDYIREDLKDMVIVVNGVDIERSLEVLSYALGRGSVQKVYDGEETLEISDKLKELKVGTVSFKENEREELYVLYEDEEESTYCKYDKVNSAVFVVTFGITMSDIIDLLRGRIGNKDLTLRINGSVVSNNKTLASAFELDE